MPELKTASTEKQRYNSKSLFNHVRAALSITERESTVFRDMTRRVVDFHMRQALDAMQHDFNEINKQETQG